MINYYTKAGSILPSSRKSPFKAEWQNLRTWKGRPLYDIADRPLYTSVAALNFNAYFYVGGGGWLVFLVYIFFDQESSENWFVIYKYKKAAM